MAGREPRVRLRRHSPHLPQDAGLVTHGPPSVGEAHREVKRSQDGNSGRIGGDEVQVATAGATVRLGDVAMLIVHSDPESEAVPEQEQMASGAPPTIHYPPPFPHYALKAAHLRRQKALVLVPL